MWKICSFFCDTSHISVGDLHVYSQKAYLHRQSAAMTLTPVAENMVIISTFPMARVSATGSRSLLLIGQSDRLSGLQ